MSGQHQFTSQIRTRGSCPHELGTKILQRTRQLPANAAAARLEIAGPGQQAIETHGTSRKGRAVERDRNALLAALALDDLERRKHVDCAHDAARTHKTQRVHEFLVPRVVTRTAAAGILAPHQGLNWAPHPGRRGLQNNQQSARNSKGEISKR